MIESMRPSGLTRRRWLHQAAAVLAGAALPGCSRDRRDGAADEIEVCIVGSGPAGAVLALELARRGVRTLLVEGGPFQTGRPDTATEDDFLMTRVTPVRYPIDETRFLGDGGTSNLWTARCPRFQGFDFDAANSFLPKGAPWPIAYSDIEPYYTRAERELDVRGGPGGRFSPPRVAPLPPDPAREPACLSDLMGAAGLVTEVPPVSHASQMTHTQLPQFIREPSARFLRNTRIVGVLTGPGGRVTGLQARSGDETSIIRAQHFVLACGGIEAPRLLLHSRTSEFPTGIGNSFDQVGRHFTENIFMDIGTVRLPASRACGNQEAMSWQFYDEFKQRGLGGAVFEYVGSASESSVRISAVVEMRSVPTNRVVLHGQARDAFGAPAADVILLISDDERATWTHAKAVGMRIAASLGGVGYRNGTRLAWCHHHVGSCRMGRDSRTSVVDQDLKVHGTDNLFVAGSATFVTAGVGSPTLLLTALSIRLADHLAAKVRSGR